MKRGNNSKNFPMRASIIIRKFSIGASSILIGALLFLGAGTAQAAEEEGQQQVDATPSKQEVNTNTSSFCDDDSVVASLLFS